MLLLAIFIYGQPLLAQRKAIGKQAEKLLQSQPLQQAHLGICLYEPATDKYWYQYQDDRYFTPASNTKIFTLYTGLQLLGDSLPAIQYLQTDTALYVKGMADPSFLHPDYAYQPAMRLLTQTDKRIVLLPAINRNKRFGPGWGWSDYADYYQPELNEWPMYGNVARIMRHGDTIMVMPAQFNDPAFFSYRQNDTLKDALTDRDERSNHFYLQYAGGDTSRLLTEVPYITGSLPELAARLEDTLHKPVVIAAALPAGSRFDTLHSIPADSLFIPLMHRSDNFFAEQTLMMCAARCWDTISTAKTIRYMLDNQLRGLPHPPRWADGSGLSRYNLFTPRDFVSILTSLYRQVPQERLWAIFPTGGKGTLRNYYPQHFIHAKTGTLSGCVALSGYLVTRKKRTLVFSVLVNNHADTSSTQVRRAVERFLTGIWEKY